MPSERSDWPHAPVHRFNERGAYMVTAGTYGKRCYLNTAERRDQFLASLFRLTYESGWELHAWAVMANHYHLVALSPEQPGNLPEWIGRLHHESTVALNAADQTPNRPVWYQYWDTHLSFQRSYMARLKYVHTNPAHHGIVMRAEEYRWCSQSWFRDLAGSGFRKAVDGFAVDKLKVFDDF